MAIVAFAAVIAKMPEPQSRTRKRCGGMQKLKFRVFPTVATEAGLELPGSAIAQMVAFGTGGAPGGVAGQAAK